MTPLFGTDGIRGEAGVFPLDAPTVRGVGVALAQIVSKESVPARILIGRDTRRSSEAIESWIAAGIALAGGEPVSAGVLTTPAIAHLTRTMGFAAGVVISASHNACPDNGIKIFSRGGTKLDEALEVAIEEQIARHGPFSDRTPGAVPIVPEVRARYLDFLKSAWPDGLLLPPLKIALDCAHGAAYEAGPELLHALGVDTCTMGVTPDGENINLECGSTHPEALAELVVASGCDLGAAFDGDGDRLILVDHQGRLIDGDAILLMCARRMKGEGRLVGDGVVATVMSNLALEKALAEDGIRLYRTQVGDKYVAEKMNQDGLVLGGEQSGHIIFSELAPTGDGLLTLVQVLRILAAEGKPLAELGRLEPFPQVLVNVRVTEKTPLDAVPEMASAIAGAQSRLEDRGRLLVRYSGTEPLLRIMVEGQELGEIRDVANGLAATARKVLRGQ